MSDDDKSPCELIDEEEKKNNPVKETQDQLDSEREKEEKKEDKKKKEEEKRNRHDRRTTDEKERDRLRCRIDLITYQHRLSNLDEHLEQELKRSKIKLEQELSDLEFQKKKRKITHESELIQSRLDLKTKDAKWRNQVDRQPEYLLDPIRAIPDTDQVELVVSDRIIELTGVITYFTCEYVTDRIHYYNNQDQTLPIFLIIDYSPGGSVMSGYRILEAMAASPAPIYVVVKSYAASMAAMITSMAEHSLIYPNAIILHHQILTRTSGNLKQHQEQLKDLEEWFRRLAGPFAEKQKLTLNQLVKMMYENNSDGDWKEFGDQAVNIGWVDHVVHRIRQTNYLSNPDEYEFGGCCQNNEQPKSRKRKRSSSIDNQLPRLKPLDHWWLYDPDNYYQEQ